MFKVTSGINKYDRTMGPGTGGSLKGFSFVTEFRLVFQICRTTGIVKTGENLCNLPVYSMLHNMVTLPIRNSPPPLPYIYPCMVGSIMHINNPHIARLNSLKLINLL